MRISPRRKQAWRFAISNIVDHAKFYSRSHDAVIRVYDESGNVIETQEDKGDLREGNGSTALLIVLNRLRCGLI
jgi:hypothetical protein